MNRWRWYGWGLMSGIVIAASLGFASIRATSDAVTVTTATAGGSAVATASGTGPISITMSIAESPPDDGKLRIIAFGAHPDDCELFVGGTTCLWSKLGHHVKLVSVTNGDIGHWRMAGGPLAQRRTAEVQQVAKAFGSTAQVLDIHDGELEPTLENRRTITRLIRNWKADIVISHRPNDYHPDHRYTGVLVQDAAYMVTVPFFCPDTPPLKKNPVFLYSPDRFQKPCPFQPDIVVSIDSVIDQKVEGLGALVSQFVEGGCGGGPSLLPRDDADLNARLTQLRAGPWRQRNSALADRFREKLIEIYGAEAGRKVRHAEAFEICEYGRRPNAEEMQKLFPFIPAKK